uniref:Zinc finger protein 60 n=1 Tax=Culex pipiens TaxID=7175 RepID=A0A8D8B4R8_CULPI
MNNDDDDSDFASPLSEKKRPKKRFQCDICSKVFRGNVELSRHKDIHLDPRNRPTFRCEFCPASYKTPAGLKYHLNKHSEHEPTQLPCPDCGKVFRSIEGRKIHMTISHGADGPTFRCRECPMVFARRFHLKLHMATHGAGRHVCALCGKSFAWLKDLRHHEAKCSKQEKQQQSHANRGHHCETCGQGFETERWLKKHVASHERGGNGKSEPNVQRKVRQRRSKNDVFIGLDHLVEAFISIDPEPELEPAQEGDVEDRKNKQCQHCPMKYINVKALRNHERRKHWELLGVERAPETRGRPKKVKVRRRKAPGPPKKRKRRIVPIEYVDVGESLVGVDQAEQ